MLLGLRHANGYVCRLGRSASTILTPDACAAPETSRSKQLKSPYLRSALGFLTCENGQFHEVLGEEQLQLVDRLGFACRYLIDDDLNDYLESLSDVLVIEGNLDGLLLEGLEVKGLDLLSSFVDRTSDVQTASTMLSISMTTMQATSPG